MKEHRADGPDTEAGQGQAIFEYFKYKMFNPVDFT